MIQWMIADNWIPYYYGEKLFLYDSSNKFNRVVCNQVEKDIICEINNTHDYDKAINNILKEYNIAETNLKVKNKIEHYVRALIGKRIIKAGNQSKIIYGKENYYYPFSLSIELTNSCNFFCSHCYKDAEPNKNVFLSKEVIKDICQVLSPYLYCMEITGGEPTIHPEFMEIIESVPVKDLRLITNGSILKNLSDSILIRFSSIQVSIYGSSCEEYRHYSKNDKFQDVLEGIQKAITAGCKITAAIILRPNIIGRLEEYIFLLNKIGVRDIRFGVTLKIGRNNTSNSEWDLNYCQLVELAAELQQIKPKYPLVNIVDIDPTEGFIKEKTAEGEKYIISCDGSDSNICISQSLTVRPCTTLPESFFGICYWEDYKRILFAQKKLNYDSAVNNCFQCLKAEGRRLDSLCPHAFEIKK